MLPEGSTITMRLIGSLFLALLLIGSGAWGALAVHHTVPGQALLGAVLSLAIVVAALAAAVALAKREWLRPAFAAYGVLFAVLLTWWSTIEPSNDRAWKPEVAVLPKIEREGDQVTIRNVRNFDYRSATEIEPQYYDRTYDLDKLESIDLIASYWAGPAIAHIFVSFGFGDDDYLAVSVERRDELGEGYSTVRGLFRQYEIFYVVADERDVIRLRTNFRDDPPEDVYLYRLHGPIENVRRLFDEYIRRIESLATQPEFYNTITSNCAGNIWLNAHVNPGRVPYSWKILLSGHVPEFLYDRGLLDTSVAFAELKQRSRINDAARVAADSADFSRLIRAGLPPMSANPPQNEPEAR